MPIQLVCGVAWALGLFKAPWSLEYSWAWELFIRVCVGEGRVVKVLCEVSLPHVCDHHKPIKLYDSSCLESLATESWRFFITY